MKTAVLLFAAVALTAAFPASAQTETAAPGPDAPAAAAEPKLRDLCPDRPGKSTPACIVDAGHIQIEVGLADAVFQSHAHETITTLGATEARFGLTSTLEAEVSWAPVIVDHQRGAGDVTGSGDLTVGLRHALTAPDADGVAVSIQAFVTAPTATHGLGADGWAGGVFAPIVVPLSKTLNIGLTPEVDVFRNAAGGGTHLAVQNAVAINLTVGGATTLSAEVWGLVDDDPAGRTYQASADLFVAQQIGDNLQLDAGVYLGLNHQTPDAEVYVGISRRF